MKDLKNTIIKSMPKQDGEPVLRSHGETCRGIQHIRPRQISGSNTMIGSRTKDGILGERHPGLNSNDSLFRDASLFFFACRKVNTLAIDGRSGQIHVPHATFSHVQSLHRTHSTDDMCTLARGRVVCRKSIPSSITILLHATLSTSSPCLSSTSLVLLSSSSPNPDLLSTYPVIHCEDPRQDGISTEDASSTATASSRTRSRYEPKRIELNKNLDNLQNQKIDDQDDMEDIGVEKMSYSQSLVHSLSLRFGRKHCDAARLGPRRRAIT